MKEDMKYAAVLSDIHRLMEKKNPAMVAIDGRCGSGKTCLAKKLAADLPCTVIHMDDFYLPFDKREPDWMQTVGGNMDFERLLSELLLPIRAGEKALYRPYCCREGRMGPTAEIAVLPLTIVEGSYSHHPRLTDLYDLKIFLTCCRQEQYSRLQQREGERFAAFEQRWIPLEEQYFKTCGVERGSDLVIDTSFTII